METGASLGCRGKAGGDGGTAGWETGRGEDGDGEEEKDPRGGYKIGVTSVPQLFW